MTSVLAYSQKAIRVAKYTTSRTSSTPFLMDSKWAMKLKELITSTTACGAQPLKKPSTMRVPLKMNQKQITTDTTNAMTWFLVVAEMQEPMARKPPAISRLPR